MPRDDACANWRWDTDEKQCLTEGRAFARFLRPLALRPTPPPEASVYPGIFSLRWMQTSQPRAFTRHLRPAGAPEGSQARPDRFLPQPPFRKFRNFRPRKKKKKRFIYLFTSREMSLIDVKLFHFPRRRDYRDARLQRAANR